MSSDRIPSGGADGAPTRAQLSFERSIIWLICAVQFVNILEFMMVMPLGPDFARDLGVDTSKLGIVGAAYTASAAIAGLVAATFIERFDRRTALAGALAGLVLATITGGLAFDMTSMMAARVLAGMFGGPASAVALAIVTDTVPPKRRGKAMGIVMGSFAIASVLGVPLGLELAGLAGWRMVFFAVAGLIAVLAGWSIFKLPPMTAHLERVGQKRPSLANMLSRPLVLHSLSMTATVMMGNFMIIPNLSTYLQFNLGYPREGLSLLYMVGGCLSFFTLRFAGMLTDRFGSLRVGIGGTMLFMAVFYFGFIDFRPAIPVMVVFVSFMATTSFRNVPYSALATQVPRADERARFMSIQSAVQNIASSLGAFLATLMLSEGPGGSLVGMPKVGWVGMAIVATLPLSLALVQKGVRQKAQVAPAAS